MICPRWETSKQKTPPAVRSFFFSFLSKLIIARRVLMWGVTDLVKDIHDTVSGSFALFSVGWWARFFFLFLMSSRFFYLYIVFSSSLPLLCIAQIRGHVAQIRDHAEWLGSPLQPRGRSLLRQPPILRLARSLKGWFQARVPFHFNLLFVPWW